MARRSYDSDIADKVGINAAMIYEFIVYWCKKSKNIKDGRKWIYSSINQFVENFPQMSKNTIIRSLKKLADEGYILTGNFNKMPFDHTKWYAVANGYIEEPKMGKSNNPKKVNRSTQKGQIEEPKMGNSDLPKMGNSDLPKMGKSIPTNITTNITTKENSISVTRFTPPTPQDVRNYCNEKNISIDAERFVDYYTSKGWLVGKAKMKDWRAAVRNWARNEKPNKPAPVNEFDAMLRKEGYL